jgi:hypothetical protein
VIQIFNQREAVREKEKNHCEAHKQECNEHHIETNAPALSGRSITDPLPSLALIFFFMIFIVNSEKCDDSKYEERRLDRARDFPASLVVATSPPTSHHTS